METSAKLKCVFEKEPPEKKMWQCDRCEKEFSKKYNLDRHLVPHTGNFRWYCEMCRKGFSQKDLYSSHMRSHEGLKYRCEYCGTVRCVEKDSPRKIFIPHICAHMKV